MSAHAVTPEPASPSSEEKAANAQTILNAVTLALSLGGTWTVALALRLVLPRMLGPGLFGQLHTSDSMAGTFMILSSLGLDTYVRKTLSVDPQSARAFLGGATWLRAVTAGLLLALMMGVWSLSSGQAIPGPLLLLCGVAQALLSLNASLAAIMDARGLTRKAAPLAVGAKFIYGAGAMGLLALDAPLTSVPLCMVLAEVWRGAVLWRLVKDQFPEPWKVHWRATWALLVASLPFFLNTVMHNISGDVDVMIIAFGQGAQEAGYYGAANNLAALSMVLMPLLPAVLMPAGAKAASRSSQELERLVGNVWRAVLLGSVPLCLFLTVGAKALVGLVFGPDFAPSALSLVVLAPTVVVTYGSTLCAIYLIQLNRTWFVTFTSAMGVLVNPLCNLVAVPWFHAHWGPGGAGMGAGLASLATELVVLGLMVRGGVRAPASMRFWPSLGAVVLTATVACAAVALAPWEGFASLAVGVVTYAVLGQVTGVLRVASAFEVIQFVRTWRAS